MLGIASAACFGAPLGLACRLAYVPKLLVACTCLSGARCAYSGHLPLGAPTRRVERWLLSFCHKLLFFVPTSFRFFLFRLHFAFFAAACVHLHAPVCIKLFPEALGAAVLHTASLSWPSAPTRVARCCVCCCCYTAATAAFVAAAACASAKQTVTASCQVPRGSVHVARSAAAAAAVPDAVVATAATAVSAAAAAAPAAAPAAVVCP
jgi:hypothetical protein